MRRRITTTCLGIAASAALVLGLGSPAGATPGEPGFEPGTTSNSAGTSTQRGVSADVPAVGECHLLTKAQAWEASYDQPEVDCASKHTALTVAVHQFETAPDWDNPDSYAKAVYKTCAAGFEAALPNGAKRAMTMYTWFWFIPTEAERAAGATWARCDVLLYNGKTIKPLPANDKLLPNKLPNKISRCSDKKHDYVTCDRAHIARAKHAFRYPGNKYPGVKKMKKWTIKQCNTVMNRRKPYRYSYPLKAGWKAGFQYSVCYKYTRK